MRNYALLAAALLWSTSCQMGGDAPIDTVPTPPAQGQVEQDLKGGNLAGTNFLGVNQGGVNQGGVNQGGANQSGLNQAGVNLGGANLGGTNLGGANLAGANQAGANLGGANLGGANLAGANLAGGNLGGANIAGANLAGANQAGANQAAVNLAGANLAGANLAGANQAGANQAGSNHAGANLAGANLGGTNLGGANQAGSNLGGANQAGSNLGGANLAGANLAAPNQAGSNFASLAQAIDMHWPAGQGPAAVTGQTLAPKMLYSGEDAWAGNAAAGKNPCVVLGIGSTAFPKLIAANRPSNPALCDPAQGGSPANCPAGQSSYMYATLMRLPWGFSDVYQGQMKAQAWEAVIWGSKTYCSFVVLTPVNSNGTNVDPKGVAGFIKAIFRWAAPPDQYLIMKYRAGDGVTGAETTYPTLASDGYAAFKGMMNAGAFAATSPTEYIGGLVGFISSTTNNISVNVDFATSVTLPDAGLTVLGNVDPTAARYYEGKWATFNIDGVTSVKHIQADRQQGTPASTAYGVPDTAIMAWSIYRGWKTGFINSQPIARRCSTALAMQDGFLAEVPAGKCDDGVGVDSSFRWKTYRDSSSNDCVQHSSTNGDSDLPPDTSWTKTLGPVAVSSNAYMFGTHLCAPTANTWVRSLPIAETHVHSTDFPMLLGDQDWIVADHRNLKPTDLSSDVSVSTQVIAPTLDDKVKIYDLSGATYPADSQFIDWYYAWSCTRTRPTSVQNQIACVPKYYGRADPSHAQYRLFKNDAATSTMSTWDTGTAVPGFGLGDPLFPNTMTLRYGAVRAGETTLFRLAHLLAQNCSRTQYTGPSAYCTSMPATVTIGLFAHNGPDTAPVATLSAAQATIPGRVGQGVGQGILNEAGGGGVWTWGFKVPPTMQAGVYNLRAFDNGVKFATSEFLIITAPTLSGPVARAYLSLPSQVEVGECATIGVSVENAEGLADSVGIRADNADGGVAPGALTTAFDCSPANAWSQVSVPFPQTNSNASFAFRATAPGAARISTTVDMQSSDCVTPARQFFCPTILTTSRYILVVPTRRVLKFSSPAAPDSGSCSAMTVARNNKAGVAVADPTALTVELRARSGGFYSNAACTTLINNTSIAAAQSTSPTFYFKRVSASSVVLSALSTGAYSGALILTTSANDDPIPTVTALSPTHGSAAGGTSVTVTGTNFTSAMSITVGSRACASTTYVSPTTLTCVTPSATALGAQALAVRVFGYNAVSLPYTYDAQVATISSLTPYHGALAGGATLSIVGSNFAVGSTVTIGASTCISPTRVSANQVTCVIPAGTAGAKVVTVSAPTATAATSSYTYDP